MYESIKKLGKGKAQCKLCRTPVRLFNGLKVSKWCSACRKTIAEQKKAKKKLTKGYLKREWKKLHKEAWKVFSVHIRSRGANADNYEYCYTCDNPFQWKLLHAGHFHHNKLDFDERNIHPQCAQCNKWGHGKLNIYGTKLAKELGPEGMEKLLLDSHTVSYSKDDLETIIKKYS